MPSIEWQYNGAYYRCDSSDPVILARFMLECITRASPGVPSDLNIIRIAPMWKEGKPDWPLSQSFTVPSLARLQAYLVAWESERNEPLVKPEDT